MLELTYFLGCRIWGHLFCVSESRKVCYLKIPSCCCVQSESKALCDTGAWLLRTLLN